MPFVIHPRVRKVAGRLAASTCVAMFATTGAALAASCPTSPVTSPFAQFGDTSSYFPVAGGTFEGSPSDVGWSFDNAGLTAGNEPFYVNSRSDSQSARINGDGTATSPTFCLDSTMPSFRFFARQVRGGGDLSVQLILNPGQDDGGDSRDSGGDSTLVNLSDGSTSSWTAVNSVALVGAAALSDGDSVQAQLRFRVGWGRGSWQIDDVFVDPYRLG